MLHTNFKTELDLYGVWFEHEMSPVGPSGGTLGPQLLVLLGKAVNFEELEPLWRKWVTRNGH